MSRLSCHEQVMQWVPAKHRLIVSLYSMIHPVSDWIFSLSCCKSCLAAFIRLKAPQIPKWTCKLRSPSWQSSHRPQRGRTCPMRAWRALRRRCPEPCRPCAAACAEPPNRAAPAQTARTSIWGRQHCFLGGTVNAISTEARSTSQQMELPADGAVLDPAMRRQNA